MPSVTQGYRHGPGGLYSEVDGSGPYAVSSSGVATLIGAVGASVPSAPASSATTSVASLTSSVGLLAANAARKGATIYNESTAVLYVKLGSTVSASSYTAQVSANGYYEVPFGYTGAISGIWASANGNARVTELS